MTDIPSTQACAFGISLLGREGRPSCPRLGGEFTAVRGAVGAMVGGPFLNLLWAETGDVRTLLGISFVTVSRVSRPHSFTDTRKTSPDAAGGPKPREVLTRKRMSGDAVRLRGVIRARALAPEDILPARDWPTMMGIDASPSPVVANEVIQLQPVRDRADLSFIAQAGDHAVSSAFWVPSNPISACGAITRPDVAPVRVLNPADARAPVRVPLRELARAHRPVRFRLRYARIRMVPNFRRQMRHRPSGARLAFVSRWPRLQYMEFMGGKIAHPRATRKAAPRG